ncbi:uncharacterized protein LOC121866674 [Homarus americanus]|uniref:uncharacterized protein LOC121866674 n=1 Tax=Homarus americanus TaxID=6706 RepID=UPI001C441D84|nr:uncharacterized protein LOC121866674 [Homarus americanus]
MVRVSWGGEVVIADLAHVAGDGGNGGDGDQSRPINGAPTPTSTTPLTVTPTTSATPSETPTISPAPTLSTPPTVSPPPRAPTAIVEALSDGDESAVSTSFSDDHRSLRDDLRDDLSSPRPRSPRRRPKKNHIIKMVSDDDNNNGNGNGNGDITISSDEYRRFLTLKGSPPDAAKKAKEELKRAPTAPSDDEILRSMDRMLATLSDLEDDLEPIDGVETESDSDSDEAEARRELLTDKWRQLFDKRAYCWPLKSLLLATQSCWHRDLLLTQRAYCWPLRSLLLALTLLAQRASVGHSESLLLATQRAYCWPSESTVGLRLLWPLRDLLLATQRELLLATQRLTVGHSELTVDSESLLLATQRAYCWPLRELTVGHSEA